MEAQLKRLPWQSAPGPDGVDYRLWKATPASIPLLTAIYTTCQVNCRFPEAWKRSNTILIHKSGDEAVPGNWRPISLQPTIYKIFAAVMAKRLATWAVMGGKISACQKGFLPMEGCSEHSFIMESVMSDAKRRRKDVRIMWLDLRNAFGSVSHDLLWLMMRRLQVPEHFIDLCQEIYTGSTQRVRCKEGYTDDIPVSVGIKQGCPLSPLLFNLALEALLPALNARSTGYTLENGSTVKQLVFADDISLVTPSKAELEGMLLIVHQFCEWSGLSLNVRKCGCLSIINSSARGRYVEPFSPCFGDQCIPALRWEDTYRYLGVEVGRQRSGTLDNLSKEIEATVDKILETRLADWQKLDAINTFALSKTTYVLSSSLPNRTWAAKLDSVVRKKVERAFRLPVRTISAIFHLPCKLGGFGLQSIEDNLETSTITRALKALASKDKLVSDIAWDQLRATILKRTGHRPKQAEDVTEFLHTLPPKNEGSRGDVRSLWSSLRKSLHCFNIELEYVDGDFLIECNGSCSKTPRWSSIANLLKRAKENRRLNQVLASSDQGRSFFCVSRHPSSSHWIPTGSYISFAEYKFALRARLNLLPVGTVARRLRKTQDATCRKCRSQPESLGHVLSACTPNAGLMRKRHNTILGRVVRAIRKDDMDVFVEQAISPDALKPDIVVRDQVTRETTVVDVTVPYEAGSEAFKNARALKEQKYAGLKTWMESQPEYGAVTVHAFIVGALGSWDAENRDCLRDLRIGQSYAGLFRKLCAADAIKGSHAIWKSHRATPKPS